METTSSKMPFRRQIDAIRAELLHLIRNVVALNGGCVGTFYKNLGRHHTEDQIEDEYDTSPIVPIHNPAYNCYGGFEGNTVFDLFIDPEDKKLLVTLNGEAGEDFDEPIEHVMVEGLVNIAEWFVEEGFVVAEPADLWRCETCGSADVEQKQWRNPNTGEQGYGDGLDIGDCWCLNCSDQIKQSKESNLRIVVDDWWNGTGFPVMESITGLRQQDFDPADGYQDFVDTATKLWNDMSIEEKISTWSNHEHE